MFSYSELGGLLCILQALLSCFINLLLEKPPNLRRSEGPIATPDFSTNQIYVKITALPQIIYNLE